jgi:hypothetical protein
VVGHSSSGLGSDELRPLLDSAYDTLSGQFKVNDGDELLIVSSCNDRRLVTDILDICAAEAWS